MTYKKYDKLNLIKENNNENIYANPRSTVSGLLGRNDASKYSEFFTLVPLSLRIKDKEISREKELELIDKLVKDKEVELTGTKISGDINFLMENVKDIYEEYTTERFNLDFMIDGLVVEFLDSKIRKKLGYFASGSPRFACALKFPYQEKETEVEDIVFEASPNGSGKITPSVIYKPVYFNGAKQNKTSLANYKRFKELKLGKGSKIIVQYRNDCLSYVLPIECEENKSIKPIPFTKTCPVCNSKLYIHKNDKGEETFIYCKNANCKMKIIGKINNYTNAVGIKGVELQTLEKLYNARLIETPVDLYNLSYRQVSKLEGMGSQSATNLIDSIKSTIPNDYDIISGLGISNLGPDMAKIILSEFSFDYLCDKKYIESIEFKERLNGLNGVGPIMSERIIKEFSSEKINNLLNELLLKTRFKSTKRVKAENQLIFVATGDPNKEIFSSREDMKQYIESYGHKMTSSVSSKTNYLVTENPNSGTVKNKKAKELGVKIITSEELKEMLG
jgi:DNA ligase (NAD+)